MKDRSTIRDATGILGIALLGRPSVSICMQRTNHPAGVLAPLVFFVNRQRSMVLDVCVPVHLASLARYTLH